MDESSMKFLEVMLRYENLITMFAASVAVGLVGRMIPKLSKSSIGARLQPLAPFLFTGGAVWIPGLQPATIGVGERFMLALILGWGSGHMHKIVKQTIFGGDARIKTGLTADLPAPPPLPPEEPAKDESTKP